MVIIGGGIAGLFAALYTKTQRPDWEVTIVEHSPQLGGLLASKNVAALTFDYGTHVPRETMNPIIDTLLFSEMSAASWERFYDINAGNVSLDGVLHEGSPSPFLATISNTQIEQQIQALQIGTQSCDKVFPNLEAQLLSVYGSSLVEMFFRPCIAKKIGADLSQLAPDTHHLFGLGRLILGDQCLMAELKQSQALDKVLANADQRVGVSSACNFYPKHGKGVGLWIEQLTVKAKALGINILTNHSVNALKLNNGQVTNVILQNGKSIRTQHLCWCAPIFPLLKLAGVAYQPEYKPTFRRTDLYHFAFTKPLLASNTYVDVNDANYHAFRLTLYPNLTSALNNLYRVTVEVIGSVSNEQSHSIETIHTELIALGVVGSENVLELSAHDTVPMGFPVMTTQFMQETQRQAKASAEHLNNVSLLGKAGGKVFFMQEVLNDTLAQLESIVEQDAGL